MDYVRASTVGRRGAAEVCRLRGRASDRASAAERHGEASRELVDREVSSECLDVDRGRRGTAEVHRLRGEASDRAVAAERRGEASRELVDRERATTHGRRQQHVAERESNASTEVIDQLQL